MEPVSPHRSLRARFRQILPSHRAPLSLSLLESAHARSSYQPLNVLISAYSCEPGYGSERGQGWNWSVQAARSHAVTVLTVSRGRDSIERAQREPDAPALTFHYLDVPFWPRRWSDRDKFIRLHYVIWQVLALPISWRLHRRYRFDLAHHVTFNAIDLPGFLWMLPIPFIWGPIGGGQVPPIELKDYFGRYWYLERLRALRKRMIPYNPFVRGGVRRAAALLYVNADTLSILNRLGAANLTQVIDAGANPADWLAPRFDQPKDWPIRIAWAGVLTRRKAPDLALDVAVTLREHGTPFTLTLAGSGPLLPSLGRRIQLQGLENEVTLLGGLSHEQMSDFFASADLFLFTSLHDTSGNVLLEAMAAGLPVVCLNQHGAAEIITPDCGIKVEIASRQQVVDDLARAVERLARSPGSRASMGLAGHQRIRDVMCWDRKGEMLREIYVRAIEIGS